MTVGVAFLVLAGGALVTVNVLPTVSAPQQDQFTLAPTVVAPDGTGAASIPGTGAASAHLNVSWQIGGTGDLWLYLYPPGACPTHAFTCGAAGAVAVCDGCHGSSGWSMSGPLRFPYELVWGTNDSRPINLSVSAVETWTSSSSSPLWSALIVDAVAVALGAVGVVAVFLGLFLRGGVYRGPAPVASRSADDVEEIHGRPPPP